MSFIGIFLIFTCIFVWLSYNGVITMSLIGFQLIFICISPYEASFVLASYTGSRILTSMFTSQEFCCPKLVFRSRGSQWKIAPTLFSITTLVALIISFAQWFIVQSKLMACIREFFVCYQLHFSIIFVRENFPLFWNFCKLHSSPDIHVAYI